ncbi:MAG: putative bifunctional diguanylate cyclase/phosphodiesterase, partial [Actinomycetota bacterium]
AASQPAFVAAALAGSYALLCYSALMVAREGSQERRLFRMDLGVLAAVGFALAWHLSTVPLRFTPVHEISFAVQAAGDLCLAAIVMRALWSRPPMTPALLLLVVAVASLWTWHVLSWVHAAQRHYDPGHPVDALAATTWFLLAAAAWHPSMTRVGRTALVHGPGHRGLPRLGAIALVLPLLPVADELELLDVHLPVLAGAAAVAIGLLLARSHLVVRQMRALAHTDPLTELPNRRALRTALERCLVPGSPKSLLLLDLSSLKHVNDRHGHTAGDDLLCQVADRLLQSSGTAALVCRLGGDEFAVLGGGDGRQTGVRLLDALSAPFSVASRPVDLAPSIGVVPLTPVDDDASPDVVDSAVRDALRDADLALSEAKRSGGGVVVASAALRDAHEREQALWEALPGALATGDGIVVHYQPIVDVRRDRVGSVEALVRWQHPELGLVPPDEFLDAAGRLGLMEALDAVVLRNAAHDLAAWRRNGIDDLVVSVNLSSASLLAPDLVETVTGAAASAGLGCGDLVLEITEHDAVPVVEDVAQRLRALTAAGALVAIDDFGVGYGSLNYLVGFPASAIKVDRSLVQRVGDDLGRRLLQGVAATAHGVGAQALAEGVETTAQLALVKELGFDFAQGFLFARPMPADDVPSWVRRWRARRPLVDPAPP